MLLLVMGGIVGVIVLILTIRPLRAQQREQSLLAQQVSLLRQIGPIEEETTRLPWWKRYMTSLVFMMIGVVNTLIYISPLRAFLKSHDLVFIQAFLSPMVFFVGSIIAVFFAFRFAVGPKLQLVVEIDPDGANRPGYHNQRGKEVVLIEVQRALEFLKADIVTFDQEARLVQGRGRKSSMVLSAPQITVKVVPLDHHHYRLFVEGSKTTGRIGQGLSIQRFLDALLVAG